MTNEVKTHDYNGEIDQFLTEVRNVPWLKPPKYLSDSVLQSYTMEYFHRLNLEPPPIRIVRDNWNEALATSRTVTENVGRVAHDARVSVAVSAANDLTRDTARRNAHNTVGNLIRDNTQDLLSYLVNSVSVAIGGAVTNDIIRDVLWAAAWINVADLMSEKGYTKGNPFQSLIEIYKLGCWPIGKVKTKEGQEEFVIFVPPIQKAT